MDWEEGFADGTFASAKKGVMRWSDQARQGHQAHGARRWTDLPLAVDIDSASPAEVNLIEPLIDEP